MKKNLVAVLMSAMLVGTMLVGCGNSAAPAETTEATTEAATNDAAEATADAEGCSDEVFEALQADYEELLMYRDAANEIYLADEIEQDSDIEALLTEADEIIVKMGEITQAEITDDEALELEGAMNDLVEAFIGIVGSMEIAEDDADVEEEVYVDANEVISALVGSAWADDEAVYSFYSDNSVVVETPDGDVLELGFELYDGGELVIGADGDVYVDAVVVAVDLESGTIVFDDGNALTYVGDVE